MSEQIRRNYPADYRERFAEEEIPVGYWGEPEDLAALAVFPGLAARTLHHRHGDPGRRRASPLSVLELTLLPLRRKRAARGLK